jgi:hypothetical protein
VAAARDVLRAPAHLARGGGERDAARQHPDVAVRRAGLLPAELPGGDLGRQADQPADRSLDGPATATFTVPEMPVPVPGGVRWRHQLSGAAHRAAPRVHEDTVLVAVKDEDRPAGAIEALDLATGALRWRAALGSSVKGTPVVHADAVIAVEVSGDTVGLALADGTERWRVPSPDPLRLFAFADPALAGDTVIVGDLSHLRALDAATGGSQCAPVRPRRGPCA